MTLRASKFSKDSILLAFVIVAAVVLRIHNLGALGLYGDEDHTFLAVRNILENGFPAMPSGMVYVRGTIHLGLAALSSFLFGLSEFSIRLPSVLASAAVIYLLFQLAKEIGGKRVALVTSAIYALSAWDIEMARFARMYELFLVAYLASSLAFYYGFVKGEKPYRVAASILFVITGLIHQLGIFLLIFPASLLLIRKYTLVKRWMLGLLIVSVALILRGFSRFVAGFYSRALNDVSVSVPDDAALGPTFQLANSLWASAKDWPANAFAAGILALCLFLSYRIFSLRGKGITGDVVLAGVFLAFACLLHQFGIAFWLLVYAVLASNAGYAALSREPWRSYTIFFIAMFVIWMVYGNFILPSNSVHEFTDSGIKSVLRVLFDYPFITLRQFFDFMPLVTILAVGQLAYSFHRFSVNENIGKDWLLFVGAVGPLTALGFFAEWPYLQYLYMSYPFFVVAYAKLLTYALENAVSYFSYDGPRRNRLLYTSGVVAIMLTATLSEYHSFRVAISIPKRDYSSTVKDQKVFEYLMHPDHKTTATFIQQNRRPDDIIVTMDVITLAYLDRIDYVLRTEGLIRPDLQLERDIYSGANMIRSLRMLQEVFEQNPDKRVWLLTSHEFVGPHLPAPILSQEMLRFLATQRDHIVYTGKDGVTDVYFWEARVPAA